LEKKFANWFSKYSRSHTYKRRKNVIGGGHIVRANVSFLADKWEGSYLVILLLFHINLFIGLDFIFDLVYFVLFFCILCHHMVVK